MKILSKLFVPLAVAGALAGCATTEETVAVPYAASAATPVAGASQVSVVVRGQDARTTNRGRISSKINGYGMEMAAIRAKDDVGLTVQNAISAELGARGYRLQPGGATVNAAVETFFSEFKTGLLAGKSHADVAMTVTVADANGAERYRRRVEGSGEKTIQLASGKNAAETLGEALADALRKLFGDEAFLGALR